MAWRAFLMTTVLVAPGLPRAGADTPVQCGGAYGGHLQGIAFDAAGAIYWSFTVDLVKTDPQGAVLKRVAVPDHHGDLCWKDGHVFVAVNLGKFNQEAGQADSWVFVYEDADLRLVARHAVPEVVHGAGGMDWAGEHFHVVGGLPGSHRQNYVYTYDTTFRFAGRQVLESGHTHLGIQTACHANGVWWFGCYGMPPVALRADAQFVFSGRFPHDLAYGIARDPQGRFWRGISLRGTAPGEWRGAVEPVVPGAKSGKKAGE
jgi:hypothetical protein